MSSAGISPDPDKVKAIADLPAPRNISQIRSFLGMVNQLSKFTGHLTDKTKPIRDLLRLHLHCTGTVWSRIKSVTDRPPVYTSPAEPVRF